jgi:hypothetical protein
MFPADSWWHADISQLPVHPMSSTYVGSIGVTKALKADFGSGLWDGGPIGIPYTVVNGQPGVTVTFDYADESDLVPYPIPPNPAIEGGPQSGGDRHVLIVDAATCQLYELYAAYPNGDGSWTAGSGATWNLNDNALRPDTWTSADAAGLVAHRHLSAPARRRSRRRLRHCCGCGGGRRGRCVGCDGWVARIWLCPGLRVRSDRIRSRADDTASGLTRVVAHHEARRIDGLEVLALDVAQHLQDVVVPALVRHTRDEP